MVGSYLISARMIDCNAGNEEILYEREGSSCHFKKWFTYENYEIQLRLDWDDMRNGEPRLDADIDIIDKDRREHLRKGEWA